MNKLPAVEFDGQSSYLTVTAAATGRDHTFFLVYDQGSTQQDSATVYLLDTPGSCPEITLDASQEAGGVQVRSWTITAVKPRSANMVLGARFTRRSGTFFQGAIAELIYYNRALDDQERQVVQAYLRARYGLPP
jgi:hypothetical protein